MPSFKIRCLSSQAASPYGPCNATGSALLTALGQRSPLGIVNNRLQRLRAAIKTFGPLPLSSMIKTLQSSELRKHSLVCLNDLLLTLWIGYHYPGQPGLAPFSSKPHPFRVG